MRIRDSFIVPINGAGGLDYEAYLEEVVFSVTAAAGHDSHAVGVDIAEHCVEDIAFVGEVGVEVGEPDAPVLGHFGLFELLKRWKGSGCLLRVSE